MGTNHKIATCLWFDGRAEEAVRFYTSAFKNSKIKRTNRFSDEGQEIHGREAGSVMTIDFELENLSLLALNGGSQFTFNPSISLFINLTDEKEVDELYAILSEGGQAMMPLDKYEWSDKYAWFSDRYGLSWQIMFDNSEKPFRGIQPLLFFAQEQRGSAQAAMDFYITIFKNARKDAASYYPEDAGETAGMVQHAQFYLEDQLFMAMDAGRDGPFPFSEAVSLIVNCDTQEEIDYYWDKLKEGGDTKAQVCGWLKDKFGVSWQVVPRMLDAMFEDEKSEKTKRAMRAMLQMKKLDIAELEKAYEGGVE